MRHSKLPYVILSSILLISSASSCSRSINNSLKKGSTYSFDPDDQCKPDGNYLCLSKDQYKNACLAASGLTVGAAKGFARMYGGDDELIENGSLDSVNFAWTLTNKYPNKKLCIVTIDAHGIIDGNSKNIEVEALVYTFIKSDKGEILADTIME
jgi:hypothetical protein